MKPFSPFSFRALTLLGFGLVSLPILLALLMALIRVDRLTMQVTNAIEDVSVQVNQSRQALQLLQSMQRSVSQYLVLDDEVFWHGYLNLRQDFLALMDAMLVNAAEPIAPAVENLMSSEGEIHGMLKANALQSVSDIQQHYTGLFKQTEGLLSLSNQLVDERIAQVENSASLLKGTMMQSLLVIPISLFIALLFIRLINRPLNELKPQIRRLESGDWQRPVEVTGASDIREIASILDAMRQQLNVLESQKISVIRSISHELKTPLAAIREGAELLFDGTTGSLTNTQQEVVDIVRTSADRLQRLIDDLLNFNRLLLDSRPDMLRPCALLAVLQSLHEERKLEFQSKQIQFQLPLMDYIVRIKQDHLRLILDNLLSNALKFSPIGGVIKVDLQKGTDNWRLSVVDQGPGVAPAHQEQIFDPFFRGAVQAEAKIKGSGLGLTLAKEMANKYQGDIAVGNTQQGCCMVVTLPIGLLEKCSDA
ncbi:HAMP domain-containing sensor histidine kinase [Aliiglaciecola sp. CAU 1673]|uniref:HAMP domain-containing sensor histidine kinase n=1 Tax=Aliiglaciecola sp. CAU 1673 TaxID=3032595 RepID=UPI0023D9AA76|nr:HAMP domain-containing sensor histidine kinase [Aliiglaciecola sp. CAU 1673]MDF2177824.1 HAMP domain-containing sensor histidine kinase [Aliiglaciecola sp. CAU 1673]